MTVIKKDMVLVVSMAESALFLFGNLLCIFDTHPTSLGLNLFLKLAVGSK